MVAVVSLSLGANEFTEAVFECEHAVARLLECCPEVTEEDAGRACVDCSRALAAEDAGSAQGSDEEPRNGFSGKVELNAAYDRVYQHSLYSGGVSLAAGAQFLDFGAVHGQLSVYRGATDGGLGITTVTFGPTWEFIFLGRLRPGLGAGIHHLALDQADGDGSHSRQSIMAQTFLTIDFVQSPPANMYAGLRGELTEFDGAVLGGVRLTVLGGRFKVP